nr:hypothetical protein GCM10020092_017910 [Actinoplanes digitatis]
MVFKAPTEWQSGTEGEDFIKRVIGVPGDHLVCCDDQERLMINGASLDEPYIYKDADGSAGPGRGREVRRRRAARPALGHGRPPLRLRRLAGAL